MSLVPSSGSFVGSLKTLSGTGFDVDNKEEELEILWKESVMI
jgi:hypothetical protein